MESMEKIILALIGGGFFVFLQFLITRWDNKHSEINTVRQNIEELRKILVAIKADNKMQSELINAQAKEILGLGHDKIVFLTNQIAQRGYITLKEKANLEALYIPYAKLGGNGDGKIRYDHCMSLNVVSDKEAYELDRKLKRRAYGIDIKENKDD
jgi:hypothetical protein